MGKVFSSEHLEPLIFRIRGQRVVADADLARLYGVSTKRFNQALMRNRNRFPTDFAFQLTPSELENLRSQFVTSSSQATDLSANKRRWSQFVTTSHGGRRYLPWAFTEHGALMAANILNSPRAVQMSIFVVRAFAKMRETLLASPDLARKLAALEKRLTGRLDVHEAAIVKVLQDLMQILNPPPLPPDPPQRRIGF